MLYKRIYVDHLSANQYNTKKSHQLYSQQTVFSFLVLLKDFC